MDSATRERIYAGVLGKIIGVYLGRPVEGWPYQRIVDTFGDVPYYVHAECGMPLIVADDDISGTFGFFRVLADHGDGPNIPAAAFGETWLNYIVENRTILWWGGLGRSTEHTAWLNLRDGVPSPESGSMARNGRTLTEQIGAQIFIDAIAMASPGDPDRAVDLVEKAARVSHDGVAVEAARHLAALEALAFEESDIPALFDAARPYVRDTRLLDVIDDVREACARLPHWRDVRDHIEKHHGYSVYPGPCHMIPNHAGVIAAIVLGGDDFQRSIRLASSMGWDTDCNAGNVGAFNGIRLGLTGIDSGADFRGPVADRMLVVTAAGGDVVSDAVIQARAIASAARRLDRAEAEPRRRRFEFEFPGSTQGWALCPYAAGATAPAELLTYGTEGAAPGLTVACRQVAPGTPLDVSTPTFLDFSETAGNFSTIASPTLYEGQCVAYELEVEGQGQAAVAPYGLYYDLGNNVQRVVGVLEPLPESGEFRGTWEVPSLGGMPIFRFGLQLSAPRSFTGQLRLRSVDWSGAPVRFAQTGMMMTSIWDTLPHWTQMWCASAAHFAADFTHTLCVSHPGEKGLATIGSDDWDDYRVSSRLEFSPHREGGVVARARGHRRYYALVLSEGTTASLVKRRDSEVTVLATAEFEYLPDRLYDVALEVRGETISGTVGTITLQARDPDYRRGEAGFLIGSGSMTADGFVVEALT